MCRSCYKSLRDIGKIRRYLSEEATKQLIQAFITSKLDCNNALLYKLPKTLLSKLQLLQNNAARVIAQRRKFEPIEHVRKDLHWLPIEYRIQYKINLLTFKCLHNIAPSYLADLLDMYEPARSLRSSEKNLLKEKKTRTLTGDRAFCSCAPVLWNKLPQHLRLIDDLGNFKIQLKTHLFRIAFEL